jgi:hypothetical protein
LTERASNNTLFNSLKTASKQVTRLQSKVVSGIGMSGIHTLLLRKRRQHIESANSSFALIGGVHSMLQNSIQPPSARHPVVSSGWFDESFRNHKNQPWTVRITGAAYKAAMCIAKNI